MFAVALLQSGLGKFAQYGLGKFAQYKENTPTFEGEARVGSRL
jgi:hypothetical protein